jgi:sodium-independent sulfate anion transporter 11
MSQETFATGLSNILGSFFCAYPSTGAFSRSAVMSKSGARTPFASFFVGLIVILSIYVFTPAFYYISNAALAAIIAHSVADLISGPAVWRKFWELNPSELIIFSAAYIISLFTRIDISVYVPVAISIIVQLYRSARPNYAILGRMDLDPEYYHQDEKRSNVYAISDIASLDHTMFFPLDHPTLGQYTRPIDAGVICFQPQENIIFQNAAFVFEKLVDEIEKTTRRGKPPAEKMGDRPWNNTDAIGKGSEKPLLQSVILDLSGVHQMDYSGMEALMDTAVTTERYSGQHVHWYIVTGSSPAVRKALLFAGFGNQRRNLKMAGRFLSDLRHGIEEGGHRPGVRGCRTYDRKLDAVRVLDEKNNTFDQVVVIEQVRQQRRSSCLPLAIGRKSSSAEQQQQHQQEQQQQQPELITTETNESSQWCYCHCDSSASDITNIVHVQDRFPFFFKSLHDAVRAALVEKENKDSYSLDTISVISDRDEPHSPSENNCA